MLRPWTSSLLTCNCSGVKSNNPAACTSPLILSLGFKKLHALAVLWVWVWCLGPGILARLGRCQSGMAWHFVYLLVTEQHSTPAGSTCNPFSSNHLKVTYADLALALLVNGLVGAGFGDSVDKFPKIRALQQAVENLPNIKAWIEKRPKTEFQVELSLNSVVFCISRY